MSIAVLKYFTKQHGHKINRQKKTRGQAPQQTIHDVADEPKNGGGLTVLEGLAASGLRSIRYAKEVPGLGHIIANDLDPSVVDAMRQNIQHNSVGLQVQPSVGDARIVMLQHPGKFDIVDLDPYGSPSQLLDSALQSVSDGGLLLVTATDTAVLCGSNGEACYGKYGSYPLHKPYGHEMALRILLASLEQHAARYKRYILPLLSLSIDFYVRVFVQVFTSAAEVKNCATRLGYVYQSTGCDSYYWQSVGRKFVKGNSVKYAPGAGPPIPQRCPETDAGFTMGGPFWALPIHDQEFVSGLLAMVKAEKALFPAYNKIHSLLVNVAEELPDVPLYFNLHEISKTLKCSSPRAEVLRSALVNAGYRVSGTHASPLGIKTDAPWSVIWDIMRCWIKEHPVKNKQEGSASAKILGREPEIKANFARSNQALSKAKVNGVTRYPQNPEHWGPKARHKSARSEEKKQD